MKRSTNKRILKYALIPLITLILFGFFHSNVPSFVSQSSVFQSVIEIWWVQQFLFYLIVVWCLAAGIGLFLFMLGGVVPHVQALGGKPPTHENHNVWEFRGHLTRYSHMTLDDEDVPPSK